MQKNVYTKVDYTLQALIGKIELGEIALPDLQRPFIWTNTAVRDLFDSLYLGYPVGFFLFWETDGMTATKSIGTDEKQKAAKLLVVDGQQRLTSLYAIIMGSEVIRDNFKKERIEISFDPVSEKFDVTNAATLRSHTSIPSISKLWSGEADVYDIADEYTSALRKIREVDQQEARSIRKNLTRVYDIVKTPFIALELSSAIDVEEVSEVFVRVNSKGKSLQQADFILTLMSVFWEQGRRDLEQFSYETRTPTDSGPSAYNHFVSPDPDVLLRVGIGLGFRRATLKYVYSLLTGRDLETGLKNIEQREAQFEILKKSQADALDRQNWHDFLNCIRDAGYRSNRMLLGERSIINSYIIYLIGRIDFQIDKTTLAKTITRWLFMTALTSRYSSSGESTMEGDLARFRDLNSGNEFVALLDQLCAEKLTDDYWNINVPSALANSSATNTAMMAYYASLTLAKAKALYSDRYVADLLDPTIHAPRSALERHHLFPRAHLEKMGYGQTERNQTANYAILEYSTNGMISDKAPSSYSPEFEKRFSKAEILEMHYHHALPDDWQNMDYSQFLIKRRELISTYIRQGYESLQDDNSPDADDFQITMDDIQSGEGDYQEFKSTLRRNLHTGNNDPKMELAVLRTIAGFLNAEGGKLFIGIADDGTAIGLEEDGFPNEDKLLLHLTNLINSRIGKAYNFYIEFNIQDYLDKRALVVQCKPSKSVVWVKVENDQKFYVRTGASTSEMTGADAQAYIEKRF